MIDTSQPRVYDLLHPSPAPLKKITAVSIALDFCREEINKYRRINAMNRVCFRKISFDSLIPILPSTTVKLIKDCMERVESSIEYFVRTHYEYAFRLHHKDVNDVLNDFDDFVVDYDGSISDCKTARRVIMCDRFSDVEKFLIACRYCFEEDVVKLWPSVSTVIKLHEFMDTEYNNMSLRYWVYRLRRTGFETSELGITWSEKLLKSVDLDTTSTVEYLWKFIGTEGHIRIAIEQFSKMINQHKFCRRLLPKLNEEELDEIMVLGGGESIIQALLEYPFWLDLVFPVWSLIKDRITDINFLSIVRKIIEKEANRCAAFAFPDCGEKIWKTAAVKMKKVAIKDVLSADGSFLVRSTSEHTSCRRIEFLLAVLSDMTIEERSSFWKKNWSTLICATSAEDLRELMNLCIGDQNEVEKFKITYLSSYEMISTSCSRFLYWADFQKLDEFLNLCCQDKEIKKEIKSRLLYEEFELNPWHIRKTKLLDNFIKSAIEDEEQICDFKHNLPWKLADSDDVEVCILCREYRDLMEFVDTVVLSEEVAVDLKERYFPNEIWKNLACGSPSIHYFKGDEMSNFLRWCFGNEEGVERFKRTLPIDEIVQRVAKETISENGPFKRKRRNYDLDAFMEWYFTSPEALAEFKTSFADLFEQIGQN